MAVNDKFRLSALAIATQHLTPKLTDLRLHIPEIISLCYLISASAALF